MELDSNRFLFFLRGEIIVRFSPECFRRYSFYRVAGRTTIKAITPTLRVRMAVNTATCGNSMTLLYAQGRRSLNFATLATLASSAGHQPADVRVGYDQP